MTRPDDARGKLLPGEVEKVPPMSEAEEQRLRKDVTVWGIYSCGEVPALLATLDAARAALVEVGQICVEQKEHIHEQDQERKRLRAQLATAQDTAAVLAAKRDEARRWGLDMQRNANAAAEKMQQMAKSESERALKAQLAAAQERERAAAGEAERYRAALVNQVVTQACDRTWCQLCRTEQRWPYDDGDRTKHLHAVGCVLAEALAAAARAEPAPGKGDVERIVAWLRRDSTAETEPAAWDYAAAIERGDWKERG